MDEEKENIIYTNYIGTKEEINMYAQNWNDFYSSYLMPNNNERIYAENGMIKCAIMFINKTKQSYIDFKNKFLIDEIDYILLLHKQLIMKRNRLSYEDYYFINEFIYKYLHVTGMDNIAMEKKNLGKAVLQTR